MKFLLFSLSILSLFASTDFDPDEFNLVQTEHKIELPSGPLSFLATTGMCPILQEGEIEAELFFIAFTKEEEENTNRPITFVFPGGPGGAGTMEAIITFGPHRLLTANEGRSVFPPYKWIDNQETLLEYTDLVFVDPVSCGFSQTSEEADRQSLFSVEGDIRALGDFIHTFLDFSERWNSPIYLSGSSYGTVRCAGLAQHLFQYGVAVKGIILQGCAIESSTLFSQRDQAMPDCLLLPTFAATAWYHGRFMPESPLEEVVDYARRFAFEEYAPVMLQPSRLSYVERKVFEEKLANLTGLPLSIIKRYNSRINEAIYTSEFFGSERKVLGGLDSRYSSDISTIDPSHQHDPSYLDCLGIDPAFNTYLQKALNTRFPLRKYVPFSVEAFFSWNHGTYDSFYGTNFLQRIRRALVINPKMQVFIGSGYYDCRTPVAATEYCFEHLDLPESYKENLHFEYYEAGHGLIFDHASLVKMKKDLSKFYGL
jgi:carboxypeptidase C (cathepsin A)